MNGYRIFKRLLAAFAFLTICPMPRGLEMDEGDIGRSRAFFPVVGLAVGAVNICIVLLLGRITPLIAAAVLVAAGVLLTRGLHIDGLADLFDALGGGKTRERALEIMRDSSIGAFGAAAVVLTLLLKYAAVSTFLMSAAFHSGFSAWEDPHRYAVLVIPPVVGRWCMVWLIQFFPYAREKGKGTAFKERRNLPDLLSAGAIAACVCSIFSGTAGVLVMAAATLAAHIFGAAVSRRLGGLTGDVYGAAYEIAETVLFLSLAVASASGILVPSQIPG